MSNGYSRRDLLEFLDFLAKKGLMKESTARSRKAAVNTLLSILSDEEVEDLRDLDVDDLIMRFSNMKPHDFKPASLSVYKSRLSSSLNELQRYRRDPTGFRPQVQTKERNQSASPDKRSGESKSAEEGKAEPENEGRAERHNRDLEEVRDIVFPIPLRPGVIVRISGVPADLTPEEATKIGNVVLALSGSQEP